MSAIRFLLLFEAVDDDEEVLEGWWVSPKAELFQMDGDDHHHRFALRLMNQSGRLMPGARPWTMDAAMDELFAGGWIRLALEDSDMWVEHSPRWKPTVAQDKVINRLCQEWGASRRGGGALFTMNQRRDIDLKSWTVKKDGD